MPPEATPVDDKTPIRILGVDPGSRITGYGIIDTLGTQVAYVASGCIKLPKLSLPERLHIIQEDLRTLINQHQPDMLVIEQVFVHRNANSALKLGQARGAAICAASGMEVAEYTPAEVKQIIVGHGRATKAQIQHMVGQLLSLKLELAEDAADALAIALTHARLAAQPDSLVKWGKRRKNNRRPTAASLHKSIKT